MRHILLASIPALSLLVLAACGGDGNTGSSSNTGGEARAPPAARVARAPPAAWVAPVVWVGPAAWAALAEWVDPAAAAEWAAPVVGRLRRRRRRWRNDAGEAARHPVHRRGSIRVLAGRAESCGDSGSREWIRRRGVVLSGGAYALVNADTGEQVLTGSTTPWGQGNVDASSGDRAWHSDFSSVQTPGTYYVYDTGKDLRSHEFRIATNVYRDVLKAAVRTFFYQRAGQEKKPSTRARAGRTARATWARGKTRTRGVTMRRTTRRPSGTSPAAGTTRGTTTNTRTGTRGT